MLIQQTIRPLPCHAHLAGRTVTTRPSRALRRRLRTPESLTVSQWANLHRRVTEIDANPGKWRGEMVQHAAPIMDDIGKPWVRQVWICLPERAAKTQILLNTVCWGIDQGSQAGNIFWLMPTEHDARKAMGERVIPVFRAKDDHGRPGRIARYLSDAADDTSRGAIRFNHGIRLFPAWANSPGSMASYFGRINIADECDKFPERTSEGSDPITLFLKRARDDRHRSKYVFASTPAGRFIYKGVQACQQIKTWAMRCPDCGEYVTPTSEHLVLPEGATAESVARADLHLACPACGSLWDEDARAAAFRGGREKIVKGAENPRPESIGWQIPSWVFANIPLAEIAAAYLKSKTGDHAAKIAWANGYEAIDYKEETKERKEDAILALCDDRPAGEVHVDTDILTMSVDTQDHGFWYTLRGWRFDKNLTSWLVKAGYLPSSRPDDFSALDTLIFDSEYRDAIGRTYQIAYGIIDSAGHRTAEVYEWCKRSGFFAAKGASKRKTQPVTISRLEVYPGTNKPIPGGLNLYSLDTHFHKSMLVNKLEIDPTDPGAWVLHSGAHILQFGALAQDPALKLPHALEVYAKHFCAEYRDERGLWQCPDGAANHLFDCEQQQIAMANYLGFANMISEKEPAPPQKQPSEHKTHVSDSSRPNWFHSRR